MPRTFIDDIEDHLGRISKGPWRLQPVDTKTNKKILIKAGCPLNSNYGYTVGMNKEDSSFIEKSPSYISNLLRYIHQLEERQ